MREMQSNIKCQGLPKFPSFFRFLFIRSSLLTLHQTKLKYYFQGQVWQKTSLIKMQLEDDGVEIVNHIKQMLMSILRDDKWH